LPRHLLTGTEPERRYGELGLEVTAEGLDLAGDGPGVGVWRTGWAGRHTRFSTISEQVPLVRGHQGHTRISRRRGAATPGAARIERVGPVPHTTPGNALGYSAADVERWVPEPPKSKSRTPFERARARVVHSSALRRLGAKTQVLGPGSDDFV